MAEEKLYWCTASNKDPLDLFDGGGGILHRDSCHGEMSHCSARVAHVVVVSLGILTLSSATLTPTKQESTGDVGMWSRLKLGPQGAVISIPNRFTDRSTRLPLRSSLSTILEDLHKRSRLMTLCHPCKAPFGMPGEN